MKRINSLALTIILTIALVFPIDAVSQAFAAMHIGGRTQQAAISSAVSTNCSQTSANQIMYSGDARANVPVFVEANLSAVFQMVEMLLGNLNANAAAQLSCEDIGIKG